MTHVPGAWNSSLWLIVLRQLYGSFDMCNVWQQQQPFGGGFGGMGAPQGTGGGMFGGLNGSTSVSSQVILWGG